MRISSLLITVFLIFINGNDPRASDHVPGELLVKYRSGAYPKNLQGELAKIGWAKIKVKRSKTMRQAMIDLKSDPDIIQVEYNYYGEFLSEPDDPYFDQQWYLNNTGQTGGEEDADIDAPEAWDISLGQGAIIGLIDSGVDLTHEDLADNLLPDGWDFGDDDDDPTDEKNHGTLLCGVIAAIQNNGLGISGVAPESKVLPLKVNPGGSGEIDPLDAAEAIIYAADYGVQIINLSIGWPDEEPSAVTDAVDYAVNKGVLLVAAAGQDISGPVRFPASLEDVIAVSATDDTDGLWFKSNYGPEIELSAPGVSIYTTRLGGGHTTRSGTSLSSAVVSAVAALIFANHPEFTREQIWGRLIDNADDLGDPGKDIYFGYGRVNAFNPLDPVTTSSSTSSTSTTSTTTTITTTSTTQTSTTTSSGPCLAEKIYAEDSEEIEILRYFRDNALSRTPEGREIIRLYYKWSPVIVKVMEMDEDFKEVMEEMIDGILLLMENQDN